MTEPTTKQTLEALIAAIHFVDGECPVCQGKFIDQANEDLERIGSPWRYRRFAGWDEQKASGSPYDLELVESHA